MEPNRALGLDLIPNLADVAENHAACGHSGSSFPSAKHYRVHALTVKDGTEGSTCFMGTI